MWQYALGRSLQERGRVVTFDRNNLHEPNGLPHHRDKIQYALGGLKTKLVFGERVGQMVYEPNMPFISSILEMDNVTLKGCWQSEKYLGSVETLKSDFSLVAPLRPDAEAWAETIRRAANPLFMHVRHGDYCSIPENLLYHGIMPADYYLRARKLIEYKSGPTEVFVFSDDPEWCRINLPGLVVAGNNQFEDLYLMSLCKHSVIANSSYSWWAAWLGADKNGGLVVAPAKWFVTPTLDPRDIVPERWMKL